MTSDNLEKWMYLGVLQTGLFIFIAQINQRLIRALLTIPTQPRARHSPLVILADKNDRKHMIIKYIMSV